MDEKFNIIKLPVQKQRAGPCRDSSWGRASWDTAWGGGQGGQAFPCKTEYSILFENPYISCPFDLQKGVSAHTCAGLKGTCSLQPASVHIINPGFKCVEIKLPTISTQPCHLRMQGNPSGKWGLPSGRKPPEVHHKGTAAATGHTTTAQVPAAARLRKLDEKNHQTQCFFTTPLLPQLTPTHQEEGIPVMLSETSAFHVLCSPSESFGNSLRLM